MLTPDYLLHVSEGAEAIAARLHTDVTKRITARILARQKRGDDYVLTSADKWRIESLMDAGYLRDDLMTDIATATGKQLQEIRDAFEDAGVRSAAYDDKIYKAAGLEPTPFKRSPYMQRLMQRNYDATAQLWQNYTATTADAAQQTFINAMDDIYMKVASGSMGYSQAYAEAIDDLASNGVDLHAADGNTYVLYKNADGTVRHRDTIEVATLRCVRTGVSQMTAQIGEARMDEMGVDLVVVSSHMGARPDHQVWQGKIYSRSGTDKKYPNFRESTHYGQGDGLCGWNCRHQFSPYFEGMDNPFTDYDAEENEEAYELTQQQRSMERAIRKSRRKAEVLRESAEACQDGDTKETLKELSDKAQKRLKRQIDAYSTFCDENDLRPLPERLRIARASRATGRTNLDRIEVKQSEIKQPEVKPEHITVQQAEKTYADKIAEIRERVRQKGKADESDLHEAGRIIIEERERRENARKEPIREEYRKTLDDLWLAGEGEIISTSRTIDEYIEKKLGLNPDPADILLLSANDPVLQMYYSDIEQVKSRPEYQALLKKKEDLYSKLHEARTGSKSAQDLKDLLSGVREMGHPDVQKAVKRSSSTVRKPLVSAFDCYPKDWIQYAIDSGGVGVKKVTRGSCDIWDNIINISGNEFERSFRTSIHEVGHYFEHKISISGNYVPYDRSRWYPMSWLKDRYPAGGSFIVDAEREFYQRRTNGEPLKWLGSGYRRDETARKDNFLDAYMGKDYGGDIFELVSMGFQYAYTDPERLAFDADMAEWIYGILALF